MGRRDLIDALPIRPDENVCTDCLLVPPEWYRPSGDEPERCSGCDAPRSESGPALTLSEDELERAVELYESK
ncbi:MAG: hypothetical protein ACLFMT_04895 [Halobacteriales archaeon]